MNNLILIINSIMSLNKKSKCNICPYNIYLKILGLIFLFIALFYSIIIFINFEYMYK